MQNTQVRFSQWIEEGFNLYKDNFKTLVLAAIFVVVISTVTAFILAGPMLAGLALLILGLRDKKEPKPEAGMVFRGFDYFVPAFLFIVVWGIGILTVSFILGVIPLIGQLASLLARLAGNADDRQGRQRWQRYAGPASRLDRNRWSVLRRSLDANNQRPARGRVFLAVVPSRHRGSDGYF